MYKPPCLLSWNACFDIKHMHSLSSCTYSISMLDRKLPCQTKWWASSLFMFSEFVMGQRGGMTDTLRAVCMNVCVLSALPACEYIYQRVSVMVWADNSEQRLVFCHPYISPTESHRAAVILLQMFCLWERRSLFLCFSQCVSKAVLHVFLLNCLKDIVVNANDVLCSISAF